MLNVVLVGGFRYHDPLLVSGVELVHEEGWWIYVDRLIWALEALSFDDHDVGTHHLDVGYSLEVILLM